MPTALLVRHAQASFGTADYDVLSERGERQVQASHAAFERRGVRPAVIVRGDLRRQAQTARPWVEAGVRETVDPRWNEYDADDILTHHSTTTARIERGARDDRPALSSREFQVVLDAAIERWIAAGDQSPCAETWSRFLARVSAALDDAVAPLERGQLALVVSSSGVLAALAGALIGAPEKAFVAFNRIAVNAAVSKVIVGGRGATLVSYNEHGHLEEAPGLITYR